MNDNVFPNGWRRQIKIIFVKGKRQQEVQWDGLYGVQGLCALSGLNMTIIQINQESKSDFC